MHGQDASSSGAEPRVNLQEFLRFLEKTTATERPAGPLSEQEEFTLHEATGMMRGIKGDGKASIHTFTIGGDGKASVHTFTIGGDGKASVHTFTRTEFKLYCEGFETSKEGDSQRVPLATENKK